MRIASEFKDYYDSAMGFGVDTTLFYSRKEEQFEFAARRTECKKWMPRNLDAALRIPLLLVEQLPRIIGERGKHRKNPFQIPITVKIIGFCGFFFAAIEIDGATYYSVEDIPVQISDTFLTLHKSSRKEIAGMLRSNEGDASRYYWWTPAKLLTLRNWQKAISEFEEKRFDETFIEADAPIFKVEYFAPNSFRDKDLLRCTLNPCLRRESFQKIKPPAQAFQEIAMYLGNQLARQADPVASIPDEILRDEKGFDKWSFRRHKDEKRKE